MKKCLIVVLAIVVFVSAAFAAVSLENVRSLADVESVLGTATTKGNDGTDYISYSSVPQAFIVSKWIRVNTPTSPSTDLSVGTEVAQGSPCTIRLNVENIEAENPGGIVPVTTVKLSTILSKDDWKAVAENGLLTDLNDSSNGFTLTLIKRIEIDATNWTLSNGNPLPVGETAALGLVSVYPTPSTGMISTIEQLNQFCQDGKGQITASEFPFAWLFIPGESVKINVEGGLPTVKSGGEFVFMNEELIVGTCYLVIDSKVYLEFKPTNLTEQKMLGLPGYLDRAKEVREGNNTVVVVEGFVASWRIPKGITVETDQGVLKAGESVMRTAWGTIRGSYTPENPNTGTGEGGGGGGCNAGNFGVLGLFAPAFALVLQRKRRS